MSEKTLIRLSDGEPESFPTKQAERILDLQQRTGLVDYKDPDAEEPTAEAQPTTADADNGPTGNPTDNQASQSGDAKKSGRGQRSAEVPRADGNE